MSGRRVVPSSHSLLVYCLVIITSEVAAYNDSHNFSSEKNSEASCPNKSWIKHQDRCFKVFDFDTLPPFQPDVSMFASPPPDIMSPSRSPEVHGAVQSDLASISIPPVTTERTWVESLLTCLSEGSVLATMASPGEYRTVAALTSNRPDPCWVGLRKYLFKKPERGWIWIDDEIAINHHSLSWVRNQSEIPTPETDSYRCAHINQEGKIGESRCWGPASRLHCVVCGTLPQEKIDSMPSHAYLKSLNLESLRNHPIYSSSHHDTSPIVNLRTPHDGTWIDTVSKPTTSTTSLPTRAETTPAHPQTQESFVPETEPYDLAETKELPSPEVIRELPSDTLEVIEESFATISENKDLITSIVEVSEPYIVATPPNIKIASINVGNPLIESQINETPEINPAQPFQWSSSKPAPTNNTSYIENQEIPEVEPLIPDSIQQENRFNPFLPGSGHLIIDPDMKPRSRVWDYYEELKNLLLVSETVIFVTTALLVALLALLIVRRSKFRSNYQDDQANYTPPTEQSTVPRALSPIFLHPNKSYDRSPLEKEDKLSRESMNQFAGQASDFSKEGLETVRSVHIHNSQRDVSSTYIVKPRLYYSTTPRTTEGDVGNSLPVEPISINRCDGENSGQSVSTYMTTSSFFASPSSGIVQGIEKSSFLRRVCHINTVTWDDRQSQCAGGEAENNSEVEKHSFNEAPHDVFSVDRSFAHSSVEQSVLMEFERSSKNLNDT